MELTIVTEKENPFFKRKDLEVKVKHTGNSTPSKVDLTKELATKYSVDNSQVVINYVSSQRGIGETFIKCKILNEKPKEVPKPQEVKGEQTETQASPTA